MLFPDSFTMSHKDNPSIYTLVIILGAVNNPTEMIKIVGNLGYSVNLFLIDL